MTAIPVIDISCADKKALHLQWDDAFRSYGCCILTGHDIEEDLFAEMKKEVKSFFTQPLETKMMFNFGPYGNKRGGYTPRSGEVVSQSNGCDSEGGKSSQTPPEKKQRAIMSDPVESFVLQPDTHHLHTDTLPLSSVYYKKCEELLHCLHTLSSRALGILEENEKDFFRKYYCAQDKDARGAGLPSLALRLAYYPPQEEPMNADKDNTEYKDQQRENIEADEPEIRYGAHTDYMGFTLLRPDEGDWSAEMEGSGGLEVYDRRRECWTPVIIPENIRKTALIINAGDLLQRWTNDRWLSPLHRVTGPVSHSEAAKQSRTALVFFSGPMADALIDVCPACCASSTTVTSSAVASGGDSVTKFALEPPKYEPVIAEDFLMSKVNPTALHIQ